MAEPNLGSATDLALAEPVADPHDACLLDDGEHAEAGVVPLGDHTQDGGILPQLGLRIRRHDAPIGAVGHG